MRIETMCRSTVAVVAGPSRRSRRTTFPARRYSSTIVRPRAVDQVADIARDGERFRRPRGELTLRAPAGEDAPVGALAA
jgi:hypothetical protein